MISLLWIATTILLYFFCYLLNKKLPMILTLPVITSSALMIFLLWYFGVDYQSYAKGGSFFTFMLGPAIVAFAIPLYKVRHRVSQFLPIIIFGVLVGLLTSFVSTILLVKLLPLPRDVVVALVPKNITLPIAISIAQDAHISVPLTSVTVVLSGCFGFALGQKMLNFFKIHHSVSRGVAIAASSHIMGTTAAMSRNEDEGAVALVTMAISAMLASFLMPLLINILFSV